MDITLISQPIDTQRLQNIAQSNYGNMVKGVVDVRQSLIALGGELHADAEALLLEKGSQQEDLWGFNIYTDRGKESRLEYTSFINIRPSQGNRALEVQDVSLREEIKKIVDSLIE